MKSLKMDRRLLAGTLALGLAMTTPGVLQAQPPEGNAPGGQRGGGRGGQRGGGQGEDMRNMTPQQMQQQMQQRREQNLRRMLTQANFADKELQDAVVAFANARDAERRTSQDTINRLQEALRNNASDEEIGVLLGAVRADLATAKTRQEAALNELDQKIGFREEPRLEAVLVLSGVTGEIAANTGGGRGGPGGPGGMGGGGRGGRGGQRGGGAQNQNE